MAGRGSLTGIIRRRNVKSAASATDQPDVEQGIHQDAARRVSALLSEGLIEPKHAPHAYATLLQLLQRKRRVAEEQEYKERVGAYAPVGLGETGLALGMGTALPWAISRAPKLWGGNISKAPSLGESFKISFGPTFLPATALMEGLAGYGLAPFSDPEYKRGERGYLGSVSKAYENAIESLRERGAEARKRYGILGVPSQAFHGILNPLASWGYLGKQLKDKILGDGDRLSMQAEDAVGKALSR
jgi:hypothetical protein